MKKRIILLLATIVFIFAFSTVAMATMPSIQYELRADNATNLKIGDEFTIALYANRTDAADSYTVSLLQDEIVFDSTVLEYIGNDFTDAILTSDNVGYFAAQSKIKCSFVSLTAPKTLSNSQLLFKLKFKAKALPTDGSSTLVTNNAIGVADGNGDRNNNVTKQDATVKFYAPKEITAFSFGDVVATINEAEKTISATVPHGTSVTDLVATFTTTGKSVKIGETVQVSGTTVNDFSNPVVYRVFAADGSYADYTVTVKPSKLGDVNDDGIIDIVDAVSILNHFLNPSRPAGAFNKSRADINKDGTIDITDAVSALLMYLRGGK